MKPVSFAGQNVVFGEGQEEYQPLPALRVPGVQGEIISCWEMSDEELEEIVRTKRIFLKQLTFNKPMQPLMPMSDLSNDIELI